MSNFKNIIGFFNKKQPNIFTISNFIIFLDIDGVICPYNYSKKYRTTKKSCIKVLNKIINYYNADICSISAWNSGTTLTHLKQDLSSRGVTIRNFYKIDHVNRIEAIKEFLLDYPEYEYFLIIDDEAYSYYDNAIKGGFISYKRILQPNSYRGLDEFDYLTVTRKWKLNI